MGNSVVGIIGGGPAGMSCALWLKQMGFAPHIIECNALLGGQLLNDYQLNRWVLGLPGQTSLELAGLCGNRLCEEQVPVSFNTKLASIERVAKGYWLILQDADGHQTSLLVKALVIATGVQALGEEVFSTKPGFDSLVAAGLVGCFPTDHLDVMKHLQGKTAAVIGGGDNAHFTVKDVAAVAARTYLLIRSRPKAQNRVRKEVEALIEQGRVIEYMETEVHAFHRTRDGIEITLNQAGSVTGIINVERVFSRIGFAPNTKFLNILGPLADLDRQAMGYILTDSRKRTSVPSVYAIGDVASPDLQTVVTAVADGAIAAQAIAQDISVGQ